MILICSKLLNGQQRFNQTVFKMTIGFTNTFLNITRHIFHEKIEGLKIAKFVLFFTTAISIKGNIVIYQCRELTISTTLLPSPHSEVFTSVSNPILEHNSHFLKCVISANNSARKMVLSKAISADLSRSLDFSTHQQTSYI